MNEERMFILKMVEEGKITAAEAAALLDALGDERDDEEERRERARRPGSDLAAQISEAIQAALRSVPNITEDVRESWNEVRKDLVQSLREMREEMKKKKLIDLSGLSHLVSHMREVGFGPAHEFEERFSGSFDAAGVPDVELISKNGSLTVIGWEQPSYEVVVRKKVYGRDEEAARRVADEAVVVEKDAFRLKVDGRATGAVTVSAEVRLPRRQALALAATTSNGSVLLEGLTLKEGRATTTNGSVRVRSVSAERLVAATVNGRVEGRSVVAEEAEVSSVNGSIDWDGQAQRALIKTVNGAVRCTPSLPAAGADSGHGEWEVRSVNGSVRLLLSPAADVGVSVSASGRLVEVDDGAHGLRAEREDGPGGARRQVHAKSPGYEEAPRRLDVCAKTVNGSVRVADRRETDRREKGDERDGAQGGTDADSNDA